MEKLRVLDKIISKISYYIKDNDYRENKLSKNRKRKIEREKMDDKMQFFSNNLNLIGRRKKTFRKNKELQVELIKRNLLIIPRNYNLNYRN